MKRLSPIEMMIDRAGLRCTRCKTPKSVGCKCWDKITLRCPVCGRAQKDFVRRGDVVVDGVMELKCPECWDKEGTKP